MAFGHWIVKVVSQDGKSSVVWYSMKNQDSRQALRKLFESEAEAEVFAEKLRGVVNSGTVDPCDRVAVVRALKSALRAGLRINVDRLKQPQFRINREQLASSAVEEPTTDSESSEMDQFAGVAEPEPA